MVALENPPKAGLFQGDRRQYVSQHKGTMLDQQSMQNLWGEFIHLKDSDGKLFVKGIDKIANGQGVGRVERRWHQQVTKRWFARIAYAENVDDLIVCSGIYNG